MDAAPLTDRDPSTWTPEEIEMLTKDKAEAERATFDPEREADQGPGNGHDQEEAEEYPKHGFSSKFVMACLHANEDGDARLFVELHRGRFLYDHAAGVWLKFSGHVWQEDLLNEATEGVEKVIEVFGLEAQRQAWQRLQAEKSGQTERAKKHGKNEEDLFS